MTKLEKAKILDELGIEWEITKTGEMICLIKMSTFAGDDCSEWLNAGDVINEMKEHKAFEQFATENTFATDALDGQYRGNQLELVWQAKRSDYG